MTDFEKWLEEAKVRAGKAEKGPWMECQPHQIGAKCNLCSCGTSFVASVETGRGICKMEWAGQPTADFIANARTDLPKALQMLEVAVQFTKGISWGRTYFYRNADRVLDQLDQIAKEK